METSAVSNETIVVLSPKGMYHGAFVGDKITQRSVDNFESKSGEKLDICLKFLAFSSGLGFPLQEAKVMAGKGSTILVKLEPWSYRGRNDTTFSLDGILAGDCDNLLKDFAYGCKIFGKPVMVSFGHEMNANWYPWAGDPEKYKKAYLYVFNKLINEYGAKNITRVWNPDAQSAFNEYFPGKENVDWIGLDGYNTTDYGAQWKTAEDVFGEKIDEAKALAPGAPIIIAETGCDANDPGQETEKAKWIADGIRYFIKQGIKGFIYFDVSKKESDQLKDWEVRGLSAAAYRRTIQENKKVFEENILTGKNEDLKKSGQVRR